MGDTSLPCRFGGISMLIVQKFGGSSVADVECIHRAAGRIREAHAVGADVVVVVSAAGDTTDDLEALAHEISASPPPREMDALLATGEQKSAALMAIALDAMGIPAMSFTGWQSGIMTVGAHQAARISSIHPARIRMALKDGYVAVISGFQGVSDPGDITTLGRGGSDTTAVALAAVLGAERCEIFTDVDGIYTADPRLVPGARLLKAIDLRDMLLLARSGSQVLHSPCVELALEHALEIRLLSSFSHTPGTAVRYLDDVERPAYAGVTRDAGKKTVSIVGIGVCNDTLAALRAQLDDAGVAVTDSQLRRGILTVRVADDDLLNALNIAHGLI